MTSKKSPSQPSNTSHVMRIGGKRYRVRTQVVVEEITADESVPLGEAQLQDDGSYALEVSEQVGESIDLAEQAILQTAFPAMRAALRTHLHEVSKKSHEGSERARRSDAGG